MQKNKINEATESNNILMLLNEIKPNYDAEYLNIKEVLDGYTITKDYLTDLEKDEILKKYNEYKEICQKFLDYNLDNSEQNRDLIQSKKIIRNQLNDVNNQKYRLFDQF